MKKFLSVFVLLGTLVMAESLVQFSIGGMTCNACASGINEGFAESFHEYIVHVDYDTTIMSVQSKDASDVNIQAVLLVLEEMGFQGRLISEEF